MDKEIITQEITLQENELMSEITELLKAKDTESAIATIKKFISISKNNTLIKEYTSLLNKLKQLEKKPKEDQFEVRLEKPTTKFKDVKGMEKLKKKISKEMILLMQGRKAYLKHKLKPTGLLFYGPPGTGKTLLADATAGEFGMNIIKPDLATLFSQWVGETEKNIVKIIQKAIDNQPCLIFIDEVDAKIRAREKIEARGESTVNLNATTQFLETMQNVHNAEYQILFIGASNRVWDVDNAAKRPGRLGNLVYVAPPTLKDRFMLFRYYLKTVENLKIGPFGYLKLSIATTRYSPSDIEEICIQSKKEMLYNNLIGKNAEYYSKKYTKDEYMLAKTANALPPKPKERLSTRDVLRTLKKDFKGSSLDTWYVESYKDMIGWEETQVEKVKGKIFTKTLKKKVKHEGKITKDERKIYKDMLKDVKRAHNRWLFTVALRTFARL